MDTTPVEYKPSGFLVYEKTLSGEDYTVDVKIYQSLSLRPAFYVTCPECPEEDEAPKSYFRKLLETMVRCLTF